LQAVADAITLTAAGSIDTSLGALTVSTVAAGAAGATIDGVLLKDTKVTALNYTPTLTASRPEVWDTNTYIWAKTGEGTHFDGFSHKFFTGTTEVLALEIDSSRNINIPIGRLRITTPETPSTAGSVGTIGTVAWDTSYIYICTATDTWKRVAIATW
jgi:hypothetical protein